MPTSFSRLVAATLANQVLYFVASAASGILLARALGPEGKGLFTLAIQLPSFAFLLGMLAVPPAITYEMARSPERARTVFGASLTIGLALSLGWFALVPALAQFFSSRVWPEVSADLILLAGPLFPLLLLGSYAACALLGLGRIKERVSILALEPAARLTLYTALLVSVGLGVVGAIVATWVAAAVALAGTLLLLRDRLSLRLSFDRATLGSLASYGLRGSLSHVFDYVAMRVDTILVGYFRDPATVALYSVAGSASEVLWHLPNAAATVLFPRTALQTQADAEESARFASAICRLSLLAALASAALVFFVAEPLIAITFGRDFAGAAPALRWLLPGTIAFSTSRILKSDLLGRGQPLYASYSAATALAITVGLDVLLIPTHGMIGAAIASSVAQVAHALLLAAAFVHATGLGVADLLLPGREDLRQVVLVASRLGAGIRLRP